MSTKNDDPGVDSEATYTATVCPQSSATVARAHRRRAGSRRLSPLDGGYSDPWRPYRGPCRGYADAARHLAGAGFLPAPPRDLDDLRVMWRSERSLAAWIAERWELAA